MIGNVCNALEDHCLQAMKIVHHYANERFDWIISEHHSVNTSREVISILSGKYKRFTFVRSVIRRQISVYFETQQTVIHSTLMADFGFGFTKGSFLLLNSQKHLRSVAEDLISNKQ